MSQRAGAISEAHGPAFQGEILRSSGQCLVSNTGICKSDADTVVDMDMKERRVTRRDQDVEDPHELILKSKSVSRLLLNR